MIFVNSMSDLFHELVPLDYIQQVFEVMAATDRHVFQVLTKRHERLAELAPDLDWPPNVWMGVSIENNRWAVRADYLRKVPSAVRFISAEPLLGPLDRLNLARVHWVIAGGESGPKHRPVRPEWLRAIRDQCQREGVRFFFKQWGGLRPQSNGRLLDGREWNEMPEHPASATNGNNGSSMPRQRDIPDDADEKWFYTEHAEAKHEILRRYLGAWLAILGQAKRGRQRSFKQLILVDAFAGRGRYMGDEPGSPQIMFDRAAKAVEAGTAESVLIRCAEPKERNFAHLKEVCEALNHEHVTIQPTQEQFLAIGTRLAAWAEQQHPPPPIFVFVDPYGVRGVPLDLLRRLLRIDRLEILLTFMVRDPSRFLMEENYEEPMTALFGGESWRECIDVPNRAECLMLRFREVVLDGVAKHATPFRVFEDEKRTVLYYLVHLTNNDLGMREMKEAMVKKAGDMTFWPVTVRPPDQLELDVGEDRPYPSLQKWLAENYSGRTLTFEELLNEDYPKSGVWVELHYRWAVLDMAEPETGEPRARITRNRTTPSGRPPRGLKLSDTIAFGS
jgi:three-Cys-motif partner protein